MGGIAENSIQTGSDICLLVSEVLVGTTNNDEETILP